MITAFDTDSAHARERIAATIDRLLARRGPGKTICPSEVARQLAADEGVAEPEQWRALMPAVRRVAGERAAAGDLVITQRGEPVDSATARGPVRIARAKRP